MNETYDQNVVNADLIIREGLKDLRKRVGAGSFFDDDMHALAHFMEARAAYANSIPLRINGSRMVYPGGINE